MAETAEAERRTRARECARLRAKAAERLKRATADADEDTENLEAEEMIVS